MSDTQHGRRSSTDTAEGTGRQEAGFGRPSMRQPERPVRRFVEDTTMAEEEATAGHASLGVPVFVMMPLDTVSPSPFSTCNLQAEPVKGGGV